MKLQKLRSITQVVSFITLNLGITQALKTGIICPVLNCYACPLANTACPIGLVQNFIILGKIPFYLIGALSLYYTSLGRAFCGWACPFGAVQDLLNNIKIRNKDFNPRPVKYSKYLVLLVTFFLAWLFVDTVFCKFCPSASLFAAIPMMFINPDLNHGFFFYVHLVTLAMAIVLFLLVSRFWCRYLCPLGAIMGTFNSVSILKISLSQEKCIKCNICLENCPMGIREIDEINDSSDCIKCGVCVEECPHNALKFNFTLN